MGQVPEKLAEIVEALGVFVPPGAEEGERAIYERALEGRCMTCGAVCGENAFAVIGRPVGLEDVVTVMLFCGGPCLTDMQLIGWIQEVHSDLTQQVAFRGGEGGN